MPRPPRIIFNGYPVAVSTRVQEDLPFVCTIEMNEIMESAIAVAQMHHPVTLMAYVVMGNHVHFEFFVESPDDIRGFMERFKTETSHAVNRQRGRRQRSVWASRYDSPMILTKEDMLKKQVYHLTNPAQANLVESIRDYPGVSSWQMMISGVKTKKVKRIRRTDVLPFGYRRQRNSCEPEYLTITIDPFAWKKAFHDTRTDDELREDLVRSVDEREEELRKERKRLCIRVSGREALMRHSPMKRFLSKKFSRRMWCICSDKDLRRSFIARIKLLREAAREVLRLWRLGERIHTYPLGMFPPVFPVLANAIFPFPLEE